MVSVGDKCIFLVDEDTGEVVACPLTGLSEGDIVALYQTAMSGTVPVKLYSPQTGKRYPFTTTWNGDKIPIVMEPIDITWVWTSGHFQNCSTPQYWTYGKDDILPAGIYKLDVAGYLSIGAGGSSWGNCYVSGSTPNYYPAWCHVWLSATGLDTMIKTVMIEEHFDYFNSYGTAQFTLPTDSKIDMRVRDYPCHDNSGSATYRLYSTK